MTANKLDSQELYLGCLSDNEFIRRASYQRLASYLHRISSSRLDESTLHLSDDCVQLAMSAIWQQIDDPEKGPKHPDQFLSWCTSIVIFKTIDELRKANRQRLESLESVPESVLQILLGSSLGTNDFTQFFIQNETAIEYLAKLCEHPNLSDKSKTILLDGYLQELTDDELALNLDVSKNNISVTRTRNRQKLRKDDDLLSILRR